jgi:hypothetical protein
MVVLAPFTMGFRRSSGGCGGGSPRQIQFQARTTPGTQTVALSPAHTEDVRLFPGSDDGTASIA